MWRSVKLKTLLERQDKIIFFYLGSYTTWYINCFPNNLKLQSSMLSYEICGGVQTASQGLMSIHSYSLGVRSLPFGFRCLSSLVFAKSFFLFPTLPPTVSMVGMLGSTG